MKKIIRQKTFETNSSSTHALIFCTEDEYDKLKKGELWLDSRYSYATIITQEEAEKCIEEIWEETAKHEGKTVEELKKKAAEEYDDPLDYIKYDYDDIPCKLEDWMSNYEQDTYLYNHKGEKIIAHCAYGYEG